MIEIFFRFFKHVLGCRHLLSYCQNGIELQTYAAIIACMLIALWTGRKLSLIHIYIQKVPDNVEFVGIDERTEQYSMQIPFRTKDDVWRL